jgi:hypothetical protein
VTVLGHTWWQLIVVGFFVGIGLAFGTALGNGLMSLFHRQPTR